MKKHSPVVVYLQNPREKYWCILLSIADAGVNVRGNRSELVRGLDAGDGEG